MFDVYNVFDVCLSLFDVKSKQTVFVCDLWKSPSSCLPDQARAFCSWQRFCIYMLQNDRWHKSVCIPCGDTAGADDVLLLETLSMGTHAGRLDILWDALKSERFPLLSLQRPGMSASTETLDRCHDTTAPPALTYHSNTLPCSSPKQNASFQYSKPKALTESIGESVLRHEYCQVCFTSSWKETSDQCNCFIRCCCVFEKEKKEKCRTF